MKARKGNMEFDVFSFFTFAEYTFLALFFYYTYTTPRFKVILIACSALFFIILPLNIIYHTNIDFDSIPASAEVVFALIFTILYFYEQINDPNVTFIYGTKTFWIIVAFLLYLSVNLFPFIARAFISEKEIHQLSPITYITNILKNNLFVISFRMLPAEKSGTGIRKSF